MFISRRVGQFIRWVGVSCSPGWPFEVGSVVSWRRGSWVKGNPGFWVYGARWYGFIKFWGVK